jgi:DNA repair protein RadC
MNSSEGHRERLRIKFRQNPEALSPAEYFELLLTYAIPRRDVSPLAEYLLSHFGSLDAIITASAQELMQVDGIGESTITFLHLLDYLVKETRNSVAGTSKPQAPNVQLNLFELGSEQIKRAAKKSAQGVKPRAMRVFANDEIANTLDLLPKAAEFETLDGFKQHLNEKLPYNAAETRQRRANYIVERYFPEGNLDVPLTFYLTQHTALADLKPVVFYHLLKAEPITTKVAEELIWPALPIGRVEREQMREFVLRYLPDASASSQANMLRGLFYTYDLLGIGSANDTTLRFQLRSGTLESFLYILTSVFPEPGMYSFDALYNSPVHRWLLWDREWIRQQLYNLQDFGVLTKVSEIDTVRQFSLSVDQREALHSFFEHPERKQKSIREQAEHQNTDQEGQP